MKNLISIFFLIKEDVGVFSNYFVGIGLLEDLGVVHEPPTLGFAVFDEGGVVAVAEGAEVVDDAEEVVGYLV